MLRSCLYVCVSMCVSVVSTASTEQNYDAINVTELDTAVQTSRMKMSNFFHPAMLIPQLVMWGLAPILLANLKMLVMNALMINNMALSSAIYMTLRNIVFGPRPGPVVKYVNKGYSHHPHSRR